MKMWGQQIQDNNTHHAMHDSPFLFYNKSNQVSHDSECGLRASNVRAHLFSDRYVAKRINGTAN